MSPQQVEVFTESRLLEFTEQTFELGKRVVPRYSSKHSKPISPLRQPLVLLCLKVKKRTTYRGLVDEFIDMRRIRELIGLDSIPDPSTLCRAFDRLRKVSGGGTEWLPKRQSTPFVLAEGIIRGEVDAPQRGLIDFGGGQWTG